MPARPKEARKQYRFHVTPDGSVWPVDARGGVSQEAVDAWVLTGSLTVTIANARDFGDDPELGLLSQPDDGQQLVELQIKAAPTMPGESEYDLIEPFPMRVGASGTWEHLPIGEVILEARRGGRLLLRQQVELNKAANEATLAVTPRVGPDLTGTWVAAGAVTQVVGRASDPLVGKSARFRWEIQESDSRELDPGKWDVQATVVETDVPNIFGPVGTSSSQGHLYYRASGPDAGKLGCGLFPRWALTSGNLVLQGSALGGTIDGLVEGAGGREAIVRIKAERVSP